MKQIIKILLCLSILIGCVGCSSGKQVKGGNVSFTIPNDWTYSEEKEDDFVTITMQPKNESSKQGIVTLTYSTPEISDVTVYVASAYLYILSGLEDLEIIESNDNYYESKFIFRNNKGEILAPSIHCIVNKIDEDNCEVYYFLSSFNDCEDYTAINSIFDSIKFNK